MRLIVMGAGYVGLALLKYFKSQSHEIFITTTQEERVDTLRQYGKDVLVLNSNSDKDFQELIQSCDGIIVLVAPKNSQNYEETYLNTAKKIASNLKNRKKPFYLLYTSSTSVFGGLQCEWVTEDIELSPNLENAKILQETEQIYLNCGVDACVLRLGGIYGPNRELIDRAKRFSGKEMSGNGNEPTNHIHLEDIVAAIAFCLTHSLTGIYHAVNEDHRSRKDLYSDLCKNIGIPNPKWNSEILTKGYKVSNKKIKDAGFIFRWPYLD